MGKNSEMKLILATEIDDAGDEEKTVRDSRQDWPRRVIYIQGRDCLDPISQRVAGAARISDDDDSLPTRPLHDTAFAVWANHQLSADQ